MASWPYSTRRWQALRREKLWRDPCCQYCEPQITLATAVDHRVAISNGGDPWDMDNLVSACAPCHNRKTRYSEQLNRRVPIKGADPATGLPLDRDHWWHRATKNCSEREARERPAAFERS